MVLGLRHTVWMFFGNKEEGCNKLTTIHSSGKPIYLFIIYLGGSCVTLGNAQRLLLDLYSIITPGRNQGIIQMPGMNLGQPNVRQMPLLLYFGSGPRNPFKVYFQSLSFISIELLYFKIKFNIYSVSVTYTYMSFLAPSSISCIFLLSLNLQTYNKCLKRQTKT